VAVRINNGAAERVVEHRRHRDRSRRGELQKLLGDRGTVLDRQGHGTPQRPAQGWYAQLTGGEIVFLGDYSLLAANRIQTLP
jgi:hypothetical protein